MLAAEKNKIAKNDELMVSSLAKDAARTQYKISSRSTKTVKKSDLILFTTQLSVMLDSGVVLSDALEAIAEQSEEEKFRHVVEDISESVKQGENFSRALTVYPRIFDAMFVSMVKASEASGRMPQMLNVLSDYLSFEDETKKKIKGALTYPMIMAVMAVVATGTLMFFVLPRFIKIYEARQAALPKLTQIIVSISSFTRNPKAMTLFVTFLIVAGFALYSWLNTTNGRKKIDYLKIKTPVLGTMFKDMIIARSLRIMATMLNTGVNVIDTLEIMRGASDNYYFQKLWENCIKKIKDGYQLSDSISKVAGIDLIYPGVAKMLKAGEKSGKIGQVSDKISSYYEKKLQGSIKSAMTLIEPVMITILGSIIGTIAIALLLPIFKISSVIAH
ncbi:MAG: type II secretion system F family protein [Phycisphaerae bacterium]|nr:type II secretion system F family protein [Phycisphaerae bacterium]